MLPAASVPTSAPRKRVNSQVPRCMALVYEASGLGSTSRGHPQDFVITPRIHHKIGFSRRKGLTSIVGMKTSRAWQGVRMRRALGAADADSTERQVTIPASWEATAADALAALAPGDRPVSLPA